MYLEKKSHILRLKDPMAVKRKELIKKQILVLISLRCVLCKCNEGHIEYLLKL